MKFSQDGALVATREIENEYGKILVWKWNLRDPLLEGTVSGEYDFAFTLDNRLLAAGDSGVFVEPFDVSWALAHICHIVSRNLTLDEWNKYSPGFDYVPTCLP